MSKDMNSLIIVGRLTRDMDLKYSPSGTAIGRFSIANTQTRKDGEQWIEEPHFFDCVLIGRRADALQRFLVKGQQVVVVGVIQQSRWQDKQTGQNRSKVEIKADDIQLTGGRTQQPGGSAPTPDNGFADDGFGEAPIF